MNSNIAILEDDSRRTCEMLACLNERFPSKPVFVFDNAPDMIGWLSEHLQELRLICLDHDLGPNRARSGETFDPGTGRDVADYLAGQQPICPVLIHTTNSLAAPGMVMTLEDAGWAHARVVPYDDFAWIQESWIEMVSELLAK